MRKRVDQTKFPDSDDHCEEQEPSSEDCGCCSRRHPRLDKFFGTLVQESTTHGIKYIGIKKLHPSERICWIIIMLTCVAISILMSINVFMKYYKTPVIISFQAKETVISQIPFPAITICGVNLLKASVLKQTFDRLNHLYDESLKAALDPDQEQRLFEDAGHLDHLSQFCLTAPSFRRELNETQLDANGNPDFILELVTIFQELNDTYTQKMHDAQFNNPNYWQVERDIFQEATISCEEMLLSCMWAGEILPCKELFFHVNTRHGRCCVFNMMPKFLLQKISEDEGRAIREMADLTEEAKSQWRQFGKDKLIEDDMEKLEGIKYPRRQKAGGKQYGLTVLVNPNLEEYSTCTASDGSGFKIVAHSPLSTPSIMDYGTAVPPNTEVFVDIEPEVTIVEDESLLEGIELDKRGCLLGRQQESKLDHFNFYSPENCFSECWAYHTFKNCSCVRYFMPRNATQELCGARKRQCANEVRVNLTKSFGKKSFCGHCEASCTEIIYKMQTSYFDIRDDFTSSYYTYNNSKGNTSYADYYSIVHIYMGADSFYAKQRKKLYTVFDLIANAGGLLSLMLGVSIISVVEFGFNFTIRAWLMFRPPLKDKNDKNNDDKVYNNNKAPRKHSMITRSRKRSSTTMMANQNDEYYNWDFTNRFGVNSNTSSRVAAKNNGKGLPTLPEPETNAKKSYFGFLI